MYSQSHCEMNNYLVITHKSTPGPVAHKYLNSVSVHRGEYLKWWFCSCASAICIQGV